MTRRQIRRYLEVIPAIRAGEQLEDALVAQFPYMTPTGRREAIRKWEAAAGFDESPTHTATGVEIVPKERVREFFRTLHRGH